MGDWASWCNDRTFLGERLTMVMGRSVSDSKPTPDNLLYSLNTSHEMKTNTSHALEEAYEDMFSAEEIENHKSLTPVQLAERTLLRRRDMVQNMFRVPG